MKSFVWIVLLLACSGFIRKTAANDFSSFLSLNASLAVVVDHDYMQQKGSEIMLRFQKILANAIREHLLKGGINLKFYSWGEVRLKKDFIATITIMDCKKTWNFFDSVQANSILMIAITDSDCARLPPQKALMIPVIEKGEELPQLLLDFKVQDLVDWKSCVVLLDATIMYNKSQIIETLVHDNANNKFRPIALYLYTIDDTVSGTRRRAVLKDALRPFTKNKRNQFVVYSKSIEDVIEMAEGLNLFHIHNQWLFFVLQNPENRSVESYTQNLNDGANIAFAFNETRSDCQETIDCIMTEVAMAFVSSLSKLIHEEESIYGEISDEEWEAIRPTKKEKQIELLNCLQSYLKEKTVCSSCTRWGVKTAISWGINQGHRRSPHQLDEVTPKNAYEFIDVGYWTPILGFVTSDAMFPHIKERFRNISLNVITYHNPPWQILKTNDKGAVTEASGIVIELLKELSHKLNFTYHLYNAKTLEEDVSGTSNETSLSDLDGSLTHDIPNSVVELLQKNKFLLAAVACTVDEPESKPFNYTYPISIQMYTFVSRRPDEVSRIYLFTAPFTTETWASLTGALLITAPFLYLINILVPIEELRTKGLCKMNSCFWYVYGALLQQGGMYLPRADSGRLIVGFWWIAVIVLVTTYCGNLVSFLTFPKFQPGIEYLFQTFKHKDVEQFGLRNGTFFEKYSAQTTRKDFKMFMDRAIIYNNHSMQNMRAVEMGERINIDWRINLQLIIQNEFDKNKECKYMLGQESFVEEQIGLLLPINSPYISLINDEIKRLHEMGFIDRWHKINLPLGGKCKGKEIFRQTVNHKVNIADMQGCFFVLLIGFSAAILVVNCEYLLQRFYFARKINIGQYSK